MISIVKKPKPDILVTNEQSWTQTYLTHLISGDPVPDTIKGRYRHQEIRSSLENETHNKCAYCETYIKPASFGDVEHFLPKAKYPNDIFKWENLTLACEVCNRTHKKEHDNPPLINPYIDTPTNHLEPEGPMIISKLNDQKGDTTVTVLQLNRPELLLRRAEKINSILSLLSRWELEQNLPYKNILKGQLVQEADSSKEYSLVIKSFLLRKGVLP